MARRVIGRLDAVLDGALVDAAGGVWLVVMVLGLLHLPLLVG